MLHWSVIQYYNIIHTLRLYCVDLSYLFMYGFSFYHNISVSTCTQLHKNTIKIRKSIKKKNNYFKCEKIKHSRFIMYKRYLIIKNNFKSKLPFKQFKHKTSKEMSLPLSKSGHISPSNNIPPSIKFHDLKAQSLIPSHETEPFNSSVSS